MLPVWLVAAIVLVAWYVIVWRLTVVGGMSPRPGTVPRVLMPGLKGKVLIDGAGHWIQRERPDAVNSTLIDFLHALPL